MSQGRVDGQNGARNLLAVGRWRAGWCLEAVWSTIGAGVSDSPGSYNSAKDWWDRCPADRKHLGDRNPPQGALLRFSNGNADGHICYAYGGGESVVSTDKPSAGLTGYSSISEIERSWGGRKYEGWTDWLGGWDVTVASAPTPPNPSVVGKENSVFYANRKGWVALIVPAANGKLAAIVMGGQDALGSIPVVSFNWDSSWNNLKSRLENPDIAPA